MTITDLAKTPLRNLFRHKVRTVLSSVGVMVGILTIVTMVSLGIGVQEAITETLQSAGLETVNIEPVTEEMTMFNQFSDLKRKVLITPALVEELRKRDDLVEVRPIMYAPIGPAYYLQLGDKTARVAVSQSNRFAVLHDPFSKPPEMVAGEKLADDSQGKMVISTNTAKALGYKEQSGFQSLVGQEVVLVLKTPRGEKQPFPFRVVGVLEPNYGPDDKAARTYIGLADMVVLNKWWREDPELLESQGYDGLMVKAVSLQDADEMVEDFKKRGFEVQSLKVMLDMFNRIMIVLQTMLGSVGGLALLVASIGIANTMVMAVYERTREIGIMKAIGASPGDIRALFVVEAALIGLIGGVVGVIGGWLLGLGLNEVILAIFQWQNIPVEGTFFVVTAWLVALGLAFAALVGTLAGLYPAARAARLDPLEALRHE